VKLPVTLQTDEVREQLAKPDLWEATTDDDDAVLHTAHCCTLSWHPTAVIEVDIKIISKSPCKIKIRSHTGWSY